MAQQCMQLRRSPLNVRGWQRLPTALIKLKLA